MSLDANRLVTTCKADLLAFINTMINAAPYLANWDNVGGSVNVTTRRRLRWIQEASGHQLAQPHCHIEKSGGDADRTQIGVGEFVYAGEYHEFDFTVSALTSDKCGGDATANDVSSALMQMFAQGGAGRTTLKSGGIDVVNFDSGTEMVDDELPDVCRNDHRLRVRVFLQTTKKLSTQAMVLATGMTTGPGTADITLGATLTQAVSAFRIRLLTGTSSAETQVYAVTVKDDDNSGTAIGMIPRTRSQNTLISMSMSTGKHKRVTGITITGGIAGEQWAIESVPEPPT